MVSNLKRLNTSRVRINLAMSVAMSAGGETAKQTFDAEFDRITVEDGHAFDEVEAQDDCPLTVTSSFA